MKKYVLYNPYACNNRGEEQAKKLTETLSGEELTFVDVTKEASYEAFFATLNGDDEVVICGGDGTLNLFVNAVKRTGVKNKLYYYACGSGNDFLRDIGGSEKLVELSPYIQDLPVVEVNGKAQYFLNGVGYGIDGYCCEIGDKMRAENPGKDISYTGIAIKGLLFHYKPTGATVIVDGKEYRFEKVWLAPVMNGRYYGGGMLPAPKQRRENESVSVMIFHGTGKLKTLMIFPSLFKGEHVKHTKYVSVFAGNEITIRYDEARTLQIDGETVLGVTEVTVKK